MKKCIGLLAVILLCACSSSELTQHDKALLKDLRWYAQQREEKVDKTDLYYQLVHEDTRTLIERSIQQGDYRFIGVAMGYHAGEEDSEAFGITCDQPLKTKNLVFGCVPPPATIFKLIKMYNENLLASSSFPSPEQCKVDTQSTELIKWLHEEELKAARKKKKKSFPHNR